MISFLVYQFSLEKKKGRRLRSGEREKRRPGSGAPRGRFAAGLYTAHTCARLQRDERWPPPNERELKHPTWPVWKVERTRGQGPSQKLIK